MAVRSMSLCPFHHADVFAPALPECLRPVPGAGEGRPGSIASGRYRANIAWKLCAPCRKYTATVSGPEPDAEGPARSDG